MLRAAAGQIASAKESNNYLPLVLNLGPPWGNSEVYLLFGNNTIEIPFKDWESPPGLGICPLGVIFTVCSSVSSWLALNPANVVVRAALAAKELAVCTPALRAHFPAARCPAPPRRRGPDGSGVEAVYAAQVLHTRSCTGLGMQFVRFLTACYLTFNMDSSTVTAALAALPPLVSERRVSSYAGSVPRVVLCNLCAKQLSLFGKWGQ